MQLVLEKATTSTFKELGAYAQAQHLEGVSAAFGRRRHTRMFWHKIGVHAGKICDEFNTAHRGAMLDCCSIRTCAQTRASVLP